MTDNDKLDRLIRSSLAEEEMPPPDLQAALVQTISEHPSGWRMPWWLPGTIGAMQTIGFVGGAQLLLPNSLIAYLTIPMGAALIVGAGILSIWAKQRWTRKESDYRCG